MKELHVQFATVSVRTFVISFYFGSGSKFGSGIIIPDPQKTNIRIGIQIDNTLYEALRFCLRELNKVQMLTTRLDGHQAVIFSGADFKCKYVIQDQLYHTKQDLLRDIFQLGIATLSHIFLLSLRYNSFFSSQSIFLYLSSQKFPHNFFADLFWKTEPTYVFHCTCCADAYTWQSYISSFVQSYTCCSLIPGVYHRFQKTKN